MNRLDRIIGRHSAARLYMRPCNHPASDPSDRDCDCIWVGCDSEAINIEGWYYPDDWASVCPVCRGDSGELVDSPCDDYLIATGQEA